MPILHGDRNRSWRSRLKRRAAPWACRPSLPHAVLQPGDALLFDGLCVHRTHLTVAMTQPRLSLELRSFKADALPARVAGDAGQGLP